MSEVLLQPPRPLRQSACHFLTKEPAYVPPHPPHLAQDHPRQALVLSVFFAQKEGNYEFDIPFDRQQLADYLGVDRSALSNELSKMQREGILSSKKNHFKLTPDCL
ncbi:helix-turn-helix domain-containing protein [Roseburia sp. AM51-8]|uniref:helix-turn-helix domain-containing protein n=1 Tax=Roseburia sp. AM51-8 TaxID=2292366 RepID=UPI002FE5E5A8